MPALPLVPPGLALLQGDGGAGLPAADLADYLIVVLLGASVGLAEITSRYRGDTLRALKKPAAWLYVALNAGAAALALLLIDAFEWRMGMEDSTPAGRFLWTRRLVAGLTAMVVLRSSLLTIKVDSKDVSIGPSGVLAAFLQTTDVFLDRALSNGLELDVAEVMKGVSFEKSQDFLPDYCVRLRRNLTSEEILALANVVEAISNKNATDREKAMLLGTELVKLFGKRLVDQAVRSNKADLASDEPGAAASVPEIMQGVSFDKARHKLPKECWNLSGTLPQQKLIEFVRAVGAIAGKPLSDEERATELGLELARLVGDDTLRRAVGLLGDTIRA